MLDILWWTSWDCRFLTTQKQVVIEMLEPKGLCTACCCQLRSMPSKCFLSFTSLGWEKIVLTPFQYFLKLIATTARMLGYVDPWRMHEDAWTLLNMRTFQPAMFARGVKITMYRLYASMYACKYVIYIYIVWIYVYNIYIQYILNTDIAMTPNSLNEPLKKKNI